MKIKQPLIIAAFGFMTITTGYIHADNPKNGYGHVNHLDGQQTYDNLKTKINPQLAHEYATLRDELSAIASHEGLKHEDKQWLRDALSQHPTDEAGVTSWLAKIRSTVGSDASTLHFSKSGLSFFFKNHASDANTIDIRLDSIKHQGSGQTFGQEALKGPSH